VTVVVATDEIAEQQDLKCTACHDKLGSKLLTDKGIYFENTRTLEGYDQVKGTFGKCTTCHVRKPGSTKLTKKGKELAEVVGSMEELRAWLDEHHPEPKKD
jgi:hypothetical protein